jgi:hypothetical protein
MADVFPAVGHKYLVDFKADGGPGGFKVQLDFHSETSMTYTGVKPPASPSLRAKRSNPEPHTRKDWIASSQELLAMTRARMIAPSPPKS